MSDDKTDDGDKKPERDSDGQSLGEPGAISGQGRSGGRLSRDIGTKDELKRAFERPAGKTRVTKEDEKE